MFSQCCRRAADVKLYHGLQLITLGATTADINIKERREYKVSSKPDQKRAPPAFCLTPGGRVSGELVIGGQWGLGGRWIEMISTQRGPGDTGRGLLWPKQDRIKFTTFSFLFPLSVTQAAFLTRTFASPLANSSTQYSLIRIKSN